MSILNAGEVPVMLGDAELVLKPTLRATATISRQFGGLAKARAELVAESFDAAVFVLRAGTNMADREARDLPDRVYANGLTADLLVGLIRYVAVLGNGGKPLPDEPTEVAGDEAPATGN